MQRFFFSLLTGCRRAQDHVLANQDFCRGWLSGKGKSRQLRGPDRSFTMLVAAGLVATGVPAFAQGMLAPTDQSVPVGQGGDRQAAQRNGQAIGQASLPQAAGGQVPEGAVGGMGDVNLYPRRVVMSGRDRSATVGLYNRATASGDYDITIGDMMMQPDGRLVDLASVKDPVLAAKVQSASALLRWSPRKLTLPASEAQLVRIMLRVPQGLPDGEYRAHFSAVSIPPVSEGLTIEQAAGGEGDGVGVQIVPRFGISIPVIVRVGETSATAGLKDMRIEQGPRPLLALTITREGTRSVFGDIVVSAPGARKPLAEIKGIGVYTELAERMIQIPIDPALDAAFYAPGVKLTVTYLDDDFAPGQVLAKADFIVR
ncbi:hypothetical protein OVA07_00525 [Novosphingobium sp. SL115]|uniref:hypothetical protein n=1 Tax=Novosphingobium sp. SL115 TaxID=2995150 RepID=UPI0022729644|nr:hypothetical protein [Novosphingobium sp. SL115]MCY1669498.1 hypothetical protein [Novosphingobium sp. SL115]